MRVIEGLKKKPYKVLSIILIALLLMISCAPSLTPQQKNQQEEEKIRIKKCIQDIYFVDEKDIQNYNIIDIISDNERNGYVHYSLEYLKEEACEEHADALTTPIMDSGPRTTTVTMKVLVRRH